jgi:hypothetical protein
LQKNLDTSNGAGKGEKDPFRPTKSAECGRERHFFAQKFTSDKRKRYVIHLRLHFPFYFFLVFSEKIFLLTPPESPSNVNKCEHPPPERCDGGMSQQVPDSSQQVRDLLKLPRDKFLRAAAAHFLRF